MLVNKSGVNCNYVLEIQEAFTNSKAAGEKTGKGTYKQFTKIIWLLEPVNHFKALKS